MRFIYLLLLSLAISLITNGCVLFQYDGATSKQSFILGIQKAVPQKNMGYETVEIFITNPTEVPITFTNAVLDGVELPSIEKFIRHQAQRNFKLDIDGMNLNTSKKSVPPLDERITWCQFYPSDTIPAGGSIIYQINLCNTNGAVRLSQQHSLTLSATDGTVLNAIIQPYLDTKHNITAITWSQDGSIANIQCTKGGLLKRVFINREEIVNFKLLKPAKKGSSTCVVVVSLNKPVATGDSFLVELDFGQDEIQRAFVRAHPGLLLDASGWGDESQISKNVRQHYSLDEKSTISVLPYDVACDDTRAHTHGHSAPDIVIARLKAYQKEPKRLSGVDFCTALYPAIWNIYAQMADAVIVKPYQLHWGIGNKPFIESEDEHISRAVNAAAPRPTVWIPERFKNNRYVEGEEFKVQAWMALLRGVKGIRYHYWKNSADNPFLDCPDVGIAVKSVNTDINKIRDILSPLIFESVTLNRKDSVNIYEGWCGDSGVLLLIRSLNYTTDKESNNNGRNPRFQVSTSTDVVIPFTPPLWLNSAEPTDPLTAERFSYVTDESGVMSITLPQLGSFRLIWIANSQR